MKSINDYLISEGNFASEESTLLKNEAKKVLTNIKRVKQSIKELEDSIYSFKDRVDLTPLSKHLLSTLSFCPEYLEDAADRVTEVENVFSRI